MSRTFDIIRKAMEKGLSNEQIKVILKAAVLDENFSDELIDQLIEACVIKNQKKDINTDGRDDI